MSKLRAARSHALVGALVIGFGVVAAVGALAQPNVYITRPTDGQAVSGTFYIEISFESKTAQPVTRLELYVDGERQLSYTLETPRGTGTKTFAWKTTMLPNGNHVLSAIAYDGAGLPSPTVARIRVFVDNRGGTGPDRPTPVPDDQVPPTVEITHPADGATVKGKIEIGVAATDASGVKYVFLFIDDKFKEMRNYPPFRFMQDTAKLDNGPHVLHAVATNAQSRRIESAKVTVVVDNPRYTTPLAAPSGPGHPTGPGQSVPPSVRPGVPSSPPMHVAVGPGVGPGPTTVVAPDVLPSPAPGAPSMARTGPSLASVETRLALLPSAPLSPHVRSSTPAATPLAPRPAAPPTGVDRSAVGAPVSAAKAAVPPVGDGGLSGPRATQPRFVLAPRVVSTKPGVTPSDALPRAANSAKPSVGHDSLLQTGPQRATPPRMASVPSGAGAVRPAADPLVTKQTRVAALPRSVTRLPEESGVLGGPRATAPGSGDQGKHIVHLGGKEITVVFDDTQLDLLVPPMERAGVPVGPLREIFEHTNGVVHWYPKAKRVWAKNDRTEVDLTIGNRSVRVNDEVTVLELAPFIAKGRTMVPLDFLKQALNVTVYFEPDTGHLIITSNEL